MAGTRATTALTGAGVSFVEHSYAAVEAAGSSYGEAVAGAIGFRPERVFKTLVAVVDDSPVVAMT